MTTIDDVRSSESAVITIRDAATILQCNPRTVTAALSIHGGDIPARRVGRRVILPRLPFLAWLDGESTPSEVAAPMPAAPSTAAVRAKLLDALAALEEVGVG